VTRPSLPRERGRPPGAPPRVVFFGSGSFGRAILEALAASDAAEVVGIVSTPARSAGRGGRLTPTPVAEFAAALGVALMTPDSIRTAAAAEAIAAHRPDIGILADFGRIVPPAILAVPARGILNVHPSLLPRHRGATPIPATILAGDAEAGVSIIAMDAGLDTGPVVAAHRISLDGTETAPELEDRLAALGAELLLEVVGPWFHEELTATPQDPTAATLTRPLRRTDGRLDPSRPAVQLERQVRALAPWPGTYLETTVGRVIVHAVRVADRASGEGSPAAPGGRLVPDGDGLALATGDGLLRLETIQLAGGRALPAAAVVRGHRELVGAEAIP
jgi:methionyl-tRNA formyltransferase